ncbi:MAG: hypothetical protein Q4G14_09055 [Paracoccus sp. (in: a-proteobacteria)]|uniref:hypothetical protein n=1 Tax=Paracoccus sp. TaxID=267 RepID=UPI0026E057B0|nr:hypothetical protein [Paracoccus sp. (in: a-proteobacteria)]MDO5613372.1 hypothetical protein [Paracoccus sp. (in: a-proteobacteria)]
MTRSSIHFIARAGHAFVRQVLLGLMLVLCWADGSQARLRLDDPDAGASVCEHAAMQAAAESGVPADILAGLTLTETGRRRNGVVRPWAWSANADGSGSWFDDPASALAYVEDRIAMGRPSVDVGCFQLNYRWHGENFPSVAAMLDPMTNARYAARFVRQLYQETGDWRAAAGAFHSRTPVHANRYLKRFDELRAMYQSRGFQGMTGSPETYNQFAEAAPMPVEKVRRAREQLTLLGAPIGTPVTGRAGSLAVIGDSRGALLVAGGGGPMFGHSGMVIEADLP